VLKFFRRDRSMSAADRNILGEAGKRYLVRFDV
jgi:hypothetical protein